MQSYFHRDLILLKVVERPPPANPSLSFPSPLLYSGCLLLLSRFFDCLSDSGCRVWISSDPSTVPLFSSWLKHWLSSLLDPQHGYPLLPADFFSLSMSDTQHNLDPPPLWKFQTITKTGNFGNEKKWELVEIANVKKEGGMRRGDTWGRCCWDNVCCGGCSTLDVWDGC